MKKLGIKWWLTLALGFVVGVVGPTAALLTYNHFAWKSAKRDLFYTDKNLKMIPGVMGENEYVIIEMVAAEVEQSQLGGASMILKLTNKTPSVISVSNEYATMNGYSLDSGGLYEELQPYASIEALMIVNDNLFDYDIEKITDVTIGLKVYHDRDANGNTASYFGPYTAYSEYKDYDQSAIDEKKNKGPVIYNENGIKITVLEDRYETDSYAPMQWLLIENDNDFTIRSGMSEVEINGMIISNASFFTSDIAPNSKCKREIILDMSESEKAKIKNIESINLYSSFYASSYDTPNSDFYVELPKLKIK